MRIPAGFLHPVFCVIFALATIILLIVALRKIIPETDKKKLVKLVIATVVCIALSFVNVPLENATLGCVLGLAAVALVFGPWYALPIGVIASAIQAALGNGGLYELGASCFFSAFLFPMLAYGIFWCVTRVSDRLSVQILGALIGTYVAVQLTCVLVAGICGFQALLFYDFAGNYLYCPYSLPVIIPALLSKYLLIYGTIEAVITALVFGIKERFFPHVHLKSNTSYSSSQSKNNVVYPHF